MHTASSSAPLPASPLAAHIRSYGPPGAPDRHDFAQLVLPLYGALALEIEGRTGRLDPLHGDQSAQRAQARAHVSEPAPQETPPKTQ